MAWRSILLCLLLFCLNVPLPPAMWFLWLFISFLGETLISSTDSYWERFGKWGESSSSTSYGPEEL